MALAPDDSAWSVSYKKVDGMWFAEFMFVDLEHDGFIVSMFVHADGNYELRFNNEGSRCFYMGPSELDLLNWCVDEAQEQLIKLEEEETGRAA